MQSVLPGWGLEHKTLPQRTFWGQVGNLNIGFLLDNSIISKVNFLSMKYLAPQIMCAEVTKEKVLF